jgi:hypothetical protein
MASPARATTMCGVIEVEPCGIPLVVCAPFAGAIDSVVMASTVETGGARRLEHSRRDLGITG